MSIIPSQLISISAEGNNFLSIDGTNAIVAVGVPCNWSIELADPNSPDGPYTIIYRGPTPPPGQVLPCMSLFPVARPDGTAEVVITSVQTPPHPCQTFSFQEMDISASPKITARIESLEVNNTLSATMEVGPPLNVGAIPNDPASPSQRWTFNFQ